MFDGFKHGDFKFPKDLPFLVSGEEFGKFDISDANLMKRNWTDIRAFKR
jgi:hypothetical protein